MNKIFESYCNTPSGEPSSPSADLTSHNTLTVCRPWSNMDKNTNLGKQYHNFLENTRNSQLPQENIASRLVLVHPTKLKYHEESNRKICPKGTINR